MFFFMLFLLLLSAFLPLLGTFLFIILIIGAFFEKINAFLSAL
jgi:hypothetical protein